MNIKAANRSNLEKIILLVIFLGALAFVSINYVKDRRVCKEQALILQLETIRQGVVLYQLMEKTLPKNLIELATAVFKLPGDAINRKYVSELEVNKDGKAVDPFGNPYEYNPNNGWVKSSTPGYSDW